MRTGGKKTRRGVGPVRAAWGRWKAWRTTHRSHRITARILNALTVATLTWFLVVCYVAIAWTP